MADSIRGALLFLISTIFDLYLFVLIIRIILVWVRADYFNPITQFINRLTQFIIKPMRKIIPNIGQLELASVVLIFLLEIAKFSLISSFTFGLSNPLGLLVLATADAIKLLLNTFFYAILLQVILSWLQPYSPVNTILLQFTAPIMRPIQRLIPPVGGFDLSPIPALIILQVLTLLLVNPLMALGINMALS